MSTTVETANEIRPFRVDIPDEALEDLRRRIAATRWPTKELVADRSQGVQSATIQALARYWTSDYDCPRCRSSRPPSTGSRSTSSTSSRLTSRRCR